MSRNLFYRPSNLIFDRIGFLQTVQESARGRRSPLLSECRAEGQWVKNRGGPTKADDEKAVVIRLEKRRVEMLDAFIFKKLIQAAAFTGDCPTPRQVAGARRRFLGDLIEGQLGFEAQHPTKLTILAPGMGGAEEMRECADWLRAQEERLLEEAPEPIKTGLELNKLKRLQAEDPTAFRKLLRAASEEETNDDD